MATRYEDWLRQAIRDLEHAKHSLNSLGDAKQPWGRISDYKF